MQRRGAVQPLALPPAAHTSLVESRLETEAVDALPYVDALPDGWRAAADALVREELRRSAGSVEATLQSLPPTAQLSFKARAPLAWARRAA